MLTMSELGVSAKMLVGATCLYQGRIYTVVSVNGDLGTTTLKNEQTGEIVVAANSFIRF